MVTGHGWGDARGDVVTEGSDDDSMDTVSCTAPFATTTVATATRIAASMTATCPVMVPVTNAAYATEHNLTRTADRTAAVTTITAIATITTITAATVLAPSCGRLPRESDVTESRVVTLSRDDVYEWLARQTPAFSPDRLEAKVGYLQVTAMHKAARLGNLPVCPPHAKASQCTASC